MFDGWWCYDDEQAAEDKLVLTAWLQELQAGRDPVETLWWMIG